MVIDLHKIYVKHYFSTSDFPCLRYHRPPRNNFFQSTDLCIKIFAKLKIKSNKL